MPWFVWDVSRETGEDTWDFGPPPDSEEESQESWPEEEDESE